MAWNRLAALSVASVVFVAAIVALFIATGRVPSKGPANLDRSGLVPCCAGRARDTAWPEGLVYDQDDRAIYFTDSSRRLIEKLTHDGKVTLLAGHCTRELVWGRCVGASADGKGAAASIGPPELIGEDTSSQGFYIWDSALRRVSMAGDVETVARSEDPDKCMCGCPTRRKHEAKLHSLPCDITSMALNPEDRHLYVIDYYLLKRLDRAGSLTTIMLPHVTGKYHGLEAWAKGLAFGPKGQPLILDADDSIVLVESNRSARLLAGCGPHPGTDMFGNSFCDHDHRDGQGARAMFNGIKGLAYDPDDGAIYVADDVTVRRVSLQGMVTTVVGTCAVDADGFNRCASGFRDGPSSIARFGALGGITYDPEDHALYVSDVWNHAIRRVTRTGYVSTIATLPPASGPFPAKWSADFVAPGGYLMRLWIDGPREQQRFYWHHILYAGRSGRRYGWSSQSFNVPEGFYRVVEGSQQAPPSIESTSSLCGGRQTMYAAESQRVEWNENLVCRSLQVTDSSGATVYSEIEYLFIPHGPLRIEY